MEKRVKEQERKKATEEIGNSNDTVIMPKYKKDPRLNVDKEYGIPPRELYLPLGWDENAQTKRKHYRHFETDELENIAELFPNGPSPFHTYEIKKGQSRGVEGGLFSFSHHKKDASG